MSTESTALTVVERAVVALGYNEENRKGLTALAGESSHITKITNADGREQAHAAMMKLKNTRIEIEQRGKAAREDATAFSKAVIGEEKTLVGLISSEETRLKALRDEWDGRVERERLAKIAAEEQRTAAIRLRIKVMEDLVIRAHMFKTAAEVEHAIEHVRGVDIDKGFDELRDAAAIAKEDSLRKLIEIHVILKEREAEAARLAAERAELDRQRAAQAAADKARRDNEEAERKRKADIQERIAELRGNQHLTASNGTKLIGEHLQDLEKLPTDAAIFGEFVQQAADAKTAGMLRLSALWKAAKDHEDEQARAAAQRAENARIAAEQAAAQKVIDDQRRELEARQQAEREAQAKKEREEREAEDRRVAAEQEQRNKERMAEEEQQRKNFKPEAEAIVHVLCTTYQRDAATVEGWLRGYFGAIKKRAAA